MSLYEDTINQTEGIENVNRVCVSLSGGLDSTVLLHLMVKKYGAENVYAISFDYNQRHDIELIQARRTTAELGVPHRIIDISFMGDIAKNVSAMVKGDVKTPTMEDVLGEPQPVTYMPNRNMILASITAGFAESNDCDGLALGIQKIDSYSYWDTTPEFYEAVENVLKLNRKYPIHFVAPFLNLSKIEEIKLGVELGVDFGKTWTCYDPKVIETETVYEREPAGGRNAEYIDHYVPCGVCPSDFERKNAFEKAGVNDPIVEGIWVHRRERRIYDFEARRCVA